MAKKLTDYLPSKRSMEYTPDLSEYGEFLFLESTQREFGKEAIGEVLGEQAYAPLLPDYFSHFNFQGLSIVEALRLTVARFQLPGEAQKIDRIMEAFASKFSADNPNIFASQDTAHILSYSILMLNTDLHNPQVKTKMTEKQFISNNRGINQGQDLPPALLKNIYNEIKTSKLVMEKALSPAQIKRDPEKRKGLRFNQIPVSHTSSWPKYAKEYRFEDESDKDKKLGEHRKKPKP